VDHDSTPHSGTERAHRLVNAHNAPDLLYGAIVAGSVLAVSSAHVPESAHVALAASLVTAIYWLAHVYVEAVGNRFRDREHAIHSRLLLSMRESIEVLFGSVPPILVFLLARAFGADVSHAAQIALWFTVVLLIVAGASAAYLAGARGLALVLEAMVAGAFGVLVILLKYLLH
jgi:hypothetical protein